MSNRNFTRHWSGTYSGFATKGGTDADHLRIQRQLAAEHPDNSESWRTLALAAGSDLVELIGRDAYDAWVDANIPDCGTTWKESFLKAEAEYERRAKVGVQ